MKTTHYNLYKFLGNQTLPACLVEEELCFRLPQYRCRSRFRDLSKQRCFYGGSLLRTRNRTEDVLWPDQLRYSYGNRFCRDPFYRIEASIIYLLLTAHSVQVHHLHLEGILEVGHWRIIEGNVPVLAN